MNLHPQNLLGTAYCHPELAVEFSPQQWDLLIRQARAANMLPRLCWRFEEQQLLEKIPGYAKVHLTSARNAARALDRSMRWEVYCICKALAGIDVPIVLLKGAAYTFANLRAGIGRQYEDVDILVPREELDTVERKLLLHGWVTTHTDPYDQRYYRQWMHELPPMRHVKRQSSLDVHHNILPETARLHPNPKFLFTKANLIDETYPLFILSNQDMVLHSATHLFYDGELRNGLRDLTDLDLLLREFGGRADFWEQLLARAEELELSKPLHYALRYTNMLLDTPIPSQIRQQSNRHGSGVTGDRLMDFLFVQGLQPEHSSCRTPSNGLARWMLYIRSHYQRMPLRLLIPHLVRKAFRKENE